MTTFTVFGGVPGNEHTGEIGGNQILLESDDHAYFLDFGTRFSLTGKFFEEYLKPRGSSLGLRDFLRMGLLPPIEGIYRDDLWVHEPTLWDRYRDHDHYRQLDHLDGVLISHGHQDHNGCLGFLKSEIPVYTGLMTALIGKGMQDTGSGGPDAEFSYIAPREVTDDGVLKGIRNRRVGRPHYICQTEPEIVAARDHLREFFRQHPGRQTVFEEAPVEIADLDNLGVRFFRVDHSIPGSGAFAINTPIGWIGYTGDLRRHGHRKDRTERFARELAELRPTVLLAEGTHLGVEPATEEPEVHEAALQVVRGEPGLVIADFAPRNIERLRTFRDIALEVGRRLVVTTRDAYLLEQMHVIDPEIPSPDEHPVQILWEPKSVRGHWERVLLERFAGNVIDATAVSAAPGDHILCLSFFDITNLIDLEPKGGTYIYSSSEAYDEDQAIDHERLRNWLKEFDLTIVGGLPGSRLEGPYHASGHIDGPGMEWLIETVNPEKIIPVHTQQLGWFEERWPKRVIQCRYAKPVRFE